MYNSYFNICRVSISVLVLSRQQAIIRKMLVLSRQAIIRKNADLGHWQWFNTLRPRHHGHYSTHYIFKCIFLNENVWISIKISLKVVPKGPITNIPALVQMMAWHRPGDKTLSEPIMVSLPTHICVTRPQWVKRKHDDIMPCKCVQHRWPFMCEGIHKTLVDFSHKRPIMATPNSRNR